MAEFRGSLFTPFQGILLEGGKRIEGKFHVKTGYTTVAIQGTCQSKDFEEMHGCSGRFTTTKHVLLTPMEAMKIDPSEKKNVFDALVERKAFTNATIRIQNCYPRTETKTQTLAHITQSATKVHTNIGTRCNVMLDKRMMYPAALDITLKK
jgi:hypothetical protein